MGQASHSKSGSEKFILSVDYGSRPSTQEFCKVASHLTYGVESADTHTRIEKRAGNSFQDKFPRVRKVKRRQFAILSW